MRTFFYAQLADKSYINIPADRMEVTEHMAYVYDGSQLVALVDVSMILSAHISRKNGGNESYENCTR